MTGRFEGYHWIYWVGPSLGTLVACGFYELMKLSGYETVNPGQDFDEQQDELFQPLGDPATAAAVSGPHVTAHIAPQVADQEAQDVIGRASSGSPGAVNTISSSWSGANRISSTSPEFRISQESTDVGTLRHDGAVGKEL